MTKSNQRSARKNCGVTLRRFVEFGYTRPVVGGLNPSEVASVRLTAPLSEQISAWLGDRITMVIPPQQLALSSVDVAPAATFTAAVAVFVVADRQEVTQKMYG